MKKIKLILIFLLIACTTRAQINGGGKPYSFDNILNDNMDAAKLILPRLDVAGLRKSAQQAFKKGEMLPAGEIIPVKYSLANSGSWKTLTNGDKIWRLKIQVPDAPATSLYYENFYLPEGSTLFIYNAEKTHVIGSFGMHNNNEAKVFATEIIYTDEFVVEYYEPANVKQKGSFVITGVANVYNAPEPPANIHLKNAKFGTSGSCNVNANCPEGNNWENQKKGVARILIKNGNYQGWCSGSLINNVRVDYKNYFLTANHCGAAVTAADKNQWIFYFNYEAAGCTNPVNEPSSNTITGCTMRSSASNGANSDVFGSDFLLVEFNNAIPASYNVYYPGWDASGTGSNSGVSIHHPDGDIKKISTYTSALTSRRYYTQLPDNSHWQANWVQTATDYGITEPGSSGSPLFNSSGQIVGKLSGGPSSCNEVQAKKNDYYGKISYDWITNGATASQQLRPWLDPDNTGITSLAGVTKKCSPSITITGNYSEAITQSSSWIKSSGQTTILNTASVKLDANPTDGYVLLMPMAATDFFLAQPIASGQFIAQALDGCGIAIPKNNLAPPKAIDKEGTLINPESSFAVFPNPSTGLFTLSTKHINNGVIEVYNLMGNKVYQTDMKNNTFEYKLNLSAYPKGIYLVAISLKGKKISTQKLIIK